MPFSPPPELELFERGFGLSPIHDPDEAVLSYVRTYTGGYRLTVTISPGWDTALHVALSQGATVLSQVELDGIGEFAFQAWHGDKIIRVHTATVDLRIHYDPNPSIRLDSLANGA